MMPRAFPFHANYATPAFAGLRRRVRTTSSAGFLLLLTGCGAPAAPSLILFGAYFPGWIFCAVAGVLAAIATRAAMIALNLANVLPYQLFICVAAGLVVAVSLWLLWFGR